MESCVSAESKWVFLDREHHLQRLSRSVLGEQGGLAVDNLLPNDSWCRHLLPSKVLDPGLLVMFP